VASEAPSTERDGNRWALLDTTAPTLDPTAAQPEELRHRQADLEEAAGPELIGKQKLLSTFREEHCADYEPDEDDGSWCVAPNELFPHGRIAFSLCPENLENARRVA
jgi:hypothetical protein